jgi:NAD(P)H-dependent FMN reductase
MLVQVLIGTTREGRFSEAVAGWVARRLQRCDGVSIETVDLRDHPLPFFDGTAPARAPRQYPTPEVARLGETLDRADAFVVLTAEYNHGYPAVLKNAMDWTFPEWQRKPITFVGWGNVGGARAVEQLRQVAVEFEMAPLRHAVHILPDVLVAVRTAAQAVPGGPESTAEPIDAAFAPLELKLDLLADDLAWWARALATARASE